MSCSTCTTLCRDCRCGRRTIASIATSSANFAKRSRCFIAYPAKVGAGDETRGQSEVGARFFEGAASGAVLIGQAPTAPAFPRDFDWPDAVIGVDSSNEGVQAVLECFRTDPERMRLLGKKNASEAIRRFDWAYRRMEPTPRLSQREVELARLAALADSSN